MSTVLNQAALTEAQSSFRQVLQTVGPLIARLGFQGSGFRGCQAMPGSIWNTRKIKACSPLCGCEGQ